MLSLAVSSPAVTLSVPGSHSTIQDALDAAAPGDVVVIAPGTYTEPFSDSGEGPTMLFLRTPDVTVRAGAAGDVLLNARRGGRVLWIESADGARLEGTTFQSAGCATSEPLRSS